MRRGISIIVAMVIVSNLPMTVLAGVDGTEINMGKGGNTFNIESRNVIEDADIMGEVLQSSETEEVQLDTPEEIQPDVTEEVQPNVTEEVQVDTMEEMPEETYEGVEELIPDEEEMVVIPTVTPTLTEEVPESQVLVSESNNVTDFGANGSDKKDDTAGIQRALNINRDKAVNDVSSAMTVYIPAGTYYINGTLNIYSNTTLKLDAKATIVRNNIGTKMLTGRGRANETKTGGYGQMRNITVEGGTWDGNDVKGENYVGLMTLRHGANISIKNTTLKNCTEHYLNLSATQNTLVDGVVFRDQRQYRGNAAAFWNGKDRSTRLNSVEAIHLDAATPDGEPSCMPNDGTACKDVVVRNCHFDGVFSGVGNHHAVPGSYSKNVRIENNVFKNIFFVAIYGRGFDNLTIRNNEATNVNSFLDIYRSTGESTGNTIKGDLKTYPNNLKPADTNKIQVHSSKSFVIKNDTITDAKKSGIYITVSQNIKIENNNVTKSAVEGINIYSSENITVNNNVSSNNKSAGIVADNSRNVKITKNQVLRNEGNGTIIARHKSTGEIKGNTVTRLASINIDSTSKFSNSGNVQSSAFTIKYNNAGGKGSMANTNVTYGKAVKLRKNTFTKAENTFAGWNVHRKSDNKWHYANGNKTAWYLKGQEASGYKLRVYSNQQEASKISNVDNDVVTMYAVWQSHKCTIVYNKNTGTGTMANSIVEYNTATRLRANAFKKSGQSLVGWHAHRQSDNKWLYVNGQKSEWFLKGKQSANYKLKVYGNEEKVIRISNKDKDVVTMHAVWTSNKQAKWHKDSRGWRYRNTNGVNTKDKWQKISGKWYYFKENEYMATGWNKVDDKWYYLRGGNDGSLFTGWLKSGSKWYYLKGDGSMATGWQKLGGKWYYLKEGNDGSMATGWVKVNDQWYYMRGGNDGTLVTGWLQSGGRWYYLRGGNDGSMVVGWLQSGTGWYYLEASGVMARNKWVGSYYLSDSGRMVTDRL